jgi:glutathione S-transferase
VRARCLFGQVPLVELSDGTSLVQSWAAVRALGRHNGLTPSDPTLAARVDAALEQVRDFTVESGIVGFGWSCREAGLDKVRAAAARFLPTFERVLSPFVAGEARSYADFQLFYVLVYIEELLGAGALAAFPRCAALRAALADTDEMRCYIKEHRKGLVTERYIAEVRAAQQPKE